MHQLACRIARQMLSGVMARNLFSMACRNICTLTSCPQREVHGISNAVTGKEAPDMPSHSCTYLVPTVSRHMQIAGGLHGNLNRKLSHQTNAPESLNPLPRPQPRQGVHVLPAGGDEGGHRPEKRNLGGAWSPFWGRSISGVSGLGFRV